MKIIKIIKDNGEIYYRFETNTDKGVIRYVEETVTPDYKYTNWLIENEEGDYICVQDSLSECLEYLLGEAVKERESLPF
jgi:hypothetical protein